MPTDEDVFREFLKSGVSVRVMRGLETGPIDLPCRGVPRNSWHRLWRLGIVRTQGGKLHLTELGGRMLVRLNAMRYGGSQ